MNGWLKALLALAALIVVLVGGSIGVFIAREVWKEASAEIYTTDVVNVDAEDDTIVERFYLSGFSRVADGPISRATLYVSQDFAASGGYIDNPKSSSSNAVNTLFLETGAPERWLFETNEQLIFEERSISLAPLGPSSGYEPEVALLMLLVKADTNKDERLSELDARTLALVRPDGRGLVVLADDLQGASVGVLPDPSAIVLSLDTKTGIEVLRIDLISFAILDRRAVKFPN